MQRPCKILLKKTSIMSITPQFNKRLWGFTGNIWFIEIKSVTYLYNLELLKCNQNIIMNTYVQ